MNDLLNTLFGLTGLGFGDEGVQFAFARPFPAWAWLLIVSVAVGAALWSYWRLTGPLWSRILLASLRAGVLILLAALISGPQLVRPNERIEKDWVLVLLDRSASMMIGDAPGSAGLRTRDQQLRSAISANWSAFDDLTRNRTLVWLGFDSGIYDLKAEGSSIEFGEPVGRRTSLAAALDQALARAAARPVSGVVVISDGRSTDEPGRAAIKRLQAEKVPVFTVALGSPDPVADLSIARIDSPAMAFVKDTIPLSVQVERLGAAGARAGGRVQLLDKVSGQVLDEQPLPTEPAAWTDQRSTIQLTSRPDLAGKRTWTVRLVPDGPDLVEQNNTAEAAIELVDRPIRVLHLDGYPRWEYRYIKNLLLWEESMTSASLLLASNRQYIQEGRITVDALPRSPEEWAAFDVIILGDLSSAMFGREQLEQLREHIAVRGAGLLWIGGPAATPGAWRQTPLADLLPFAMGSSDRASDQTVRPWGEPVVMVPAPQAKRLNLLELGETPAEGWPPRLSDPTTGWSQLYYAQRIEASAIKPTAEVLARFVPSSGGDAESGTPAVLSMRFGAGRVLYVATDEIWRWRYARGEVLPERFWLPLIRLQGRESLTRSARAAALEVTPRRPQVEQPVRLAVTLLDQAMLDAAPGTITVRIQRAGDPPTELSLVPESGEAVRGAARSFATTWLPPEPGKYTVQVVDAALAAAGLTGDLEATLPDDELRHPETDHPLLVRLAEQTEGKALTPNQLSELPGMLPKREIRITGTPDIESLWDKPAILILLLLMLTLEWVGRRILKLS